MNRYMFGELTGTTPIIPVTTIDNKDRQVPNDLQPKRSKRPVRDLDERVWKEDQTRSFAEELAASEEALEREEYPEIPETEDDLGEALGDYDMDLGL